MRDLLSEYLLYIKSIHIIFVVCWMAGLFYIVRLFIYHTEAQAKPDLERKILSDQFEVMERRLWNVIAVPSMFITIIAGLLMLYAMPGFLQMGWMHIKLTFVVLLIGYHHVCQSKIKQIRNGIFKWTSTQLRIWNEVATIFLFAIVFLVVVKSALNWIFGVIGIILLSIIMMMAVKLYKTIRETKSGSSKSELDEKISKIKQSIIKKIAVECDEKFWVDHYGAYDIDPKHLVFWVCVGSDTLKQKLSSNLALTNGLRDILVQENYPTEARQFVHIGFESQETVDRESDGNWFHHFK